jgi:hypothetical protein
MIPRPNNTGCRYRALYTSRHTPQGLQRPWVRAASHAKVVKYGSYFRGADSGKVVTECVTTVTRMQKCVNLILACLEFRTLCNNIISGRHYVTLFYLNKKARKGAFQWNALIPPYTRSNSTDYALSGTFVKSCSF